LSIANPYKLRRFDIYVDPNGKTLQLDSKHLDEWSRLKAWAKPFGAMPRAQFDKTAKDLTVDALAVAGGTAVGGPWVGSAVVAIRARDWYKTAQKLSTDKHNDIVKATAKWARAEIKAGRAPTLDSAFFHYSDQLYQDNVGRHLDPLNAVEFARLFRAEGL
jgi:hypothetical protein